MSEAVPTMSPVTMQTGLRSGKLEHSWSQILGWVEQYPADAPPSPHAWVTGVPTTTGPLVSGGSSPGHTLNNSDWAYAAVQCPAGTTGDLTVSYQPKYDLRETCITSVEALVRWRHPSRGFVGPDLFIPVAEKTNRIAPLTRAMPTPSRSAAGTTRTEGRAA